VNNFERYYTFSTQKNELQRILWIVSRKNQLKRIRQMRLQIDEGEEQIILTKIVVKNLNTEDRAWKVHR
jgi:hypothetical protein